MEISTQPNGVKNLYEIIAFLTAGGNHSFYEVMLVAAQAGVDIKADNYAESMPSSFKNYDFFKKLCPQFPEFLTRESDSISLGK